MKLEQSKYIEKKMWEFDLKGLPPKNLPMKPSTLLSSVRCSVTDEEREEVSKLPYRSRVGDLTYLWITRDADRHTVYQQNSFPVQQELGT